MTYHDVSMARVRSPRFWALWMTFEGLHILPRRRADADLEISIERIIESGPSV